MVFLQNSYIKILIFKVIIFGSVDFWRLLDYEGGTFMNAISTLIKGTSES